MNKIMLVMSLLLSLSLAKTPCQDMAKKWESESPFFKSSRIEIGIDTAEIVMFAEGYVLGMCEMNHKNTGVVIPYNIFKETLEDLINTARNYEEEE